jgi:hypothetical protein
MQFKNDEFILSSGRKIYAHRGIVGIGPGLELSQGYDGGINWPPQDWHEEKLTAEDAHELADMMLRRWAIFKESIKHG